MNQIKMPPKDLFKKIRDNFSIITKRGGFRAVFAWSVKRVFPIELYDFLTIPNIIEKRRDIGHSDYKMLSIRSLPDCDSMDGAVLGILSGQSGRDVRSIIMSGDRVYALVDGQDVVAQLNICLKGWAKVDTPIPLQLAFAEHMAFLNYLYTYPAHRGRGAAKSLIQNVINDLARDGVKRLVTHVSATNIGSQNTFLAGGWQRMGLLITNRRDGILLYPKAVKMAGVSAQTR